MSNGRNWHRVARRIMELALELEAIEEDYREGKCTLEVAVERCEVVWRTIRELDQGR